MTITIELLKQLYTLLQEYKTATEVQISDNSGVIMASFHSGNTFLGSIIVHDDDIAKHKK